MNGKVFTYSVVVLSLVLGVPLGFVAGRAASSVPVSPSTPTDDGVISNVKTYEIGELVVIESDSEGTTWVVEPSVPFVAYSNRLVISFKQPGQYLVFAASVIEGIVVVNRHELCVKTAGSAPDNPVAKSVWLQILYSNVPPKSDAVALAASFRSVATTIQAKINAGQLVTHEQLLTLSAASNRQAVAANAELWTATFAAIKLNLEKLASEKQLISMRDHVAVWTEIAGALETYAK
jgi:hypothetical protein